MSTLSDDSSSPVSTTVRVCSFESRKQDEMRSLIERHGGEPVLASSLKEVPLENNKAAFRFLDRLLAGQIDVVIFMTGVGAKALLEVVETRIERATFFDALQRCCVIVRGPKPTAVLRDWSVRIDHKAPEPNTWHELLAEIDGGLNFPNGSVVANLRGKFVAIQEYGQPSDELTAALIDRGASVLSVPVYRWELPDDTQPLETAIRDIVAGRFDVLLFTSAQQIRNVLLVAERLGLQSEFLVAAPRCLIGSIGPTCSAAIQEARLPVGLEPTHPHMGHLVKETLMLRRNQLGQ